MVFDPSPLYVPSMSPADIAAVVLMHVEREHRIWSRAGAGSTVCHLFISPMSEVFVLHEMRTASPVWLARRRAWWVGAYAPPEDRAPDWRDSLGAEIAEDIEFHLGALK
jgi:hypothetical protein